MWSRLTSLETREVVCQPAPDVVGGFVGLVPGFLPAFGPTGHLALQEILGVAQVIEIATGRVDGMELGEGVDHHLGKGSVAQWVGATSEPFRDLASHDDDPLVSP